MKMTLEQSLNSDYPKILPSRTLSEKVGKGVRVDVMYFGELSHKTEKAEHGLKYVDRKGGECALILTSGNAGVAFDVKSKEYEDIQVIKFVNKDRTRKLIDIKHIGKDGFGKDRHGVIIRLPDRWFDASQLEKFWKKIIKGSKNPFSIVRKYRDNREFNKLIEIFEARGLDPLKAFDVTNIRSYDKNGKSPYKIPEIKRAVREYGYIFIPYGSGELFSGFQESADYFWNFLFKHAVLVAVTSYRNPLSLTKLRQPDYACKPRKRHRKSHADKLDTPRIGKEHRRNVAMADERTYFCSLNDQIIDRAYKLMKNVIAREHKGQKTTPTGSICTGVFDEKNTQYSREGIEILKTYRFDPGEIYFYRKYLKLQPLIIKPRSKVLIVNTGGVS